MKFIYSLLENKIVVNLIAPVICSVMATMITEHKGKMVKYFGRGFIIKLKIR